MYAPGLIRGRVWPAALLSADFFYWPGEPQDYFAERSSPATRVQQGGAVGTLPNRGRVGGVLAGQTADANRGTLQWGKANLLRGSTSVRYAQTFSARTPSAIYTVAAFKTPSSATSSERIASISQSATIDDYSNPAGACLLYRDGTNASWGVYRSNAMRGSVSLANSTKGVIETICESTQTTVCLNGGTDTVTSHGAMGSFNVSSFRPLSSHGSGGFFDSSSSSSDLYALAIFLSLPSASLRARARAEALAIMRSLT